MVELKRWILHVVRSEQPQGWLQRYSLSDPANQQIAAIIIAVIMALIIVFSIGYSWAKVAFAPKSDRNYTYIPFDMYDATLLCNDEMEARMGARLLRSYVDHHSTRLDNSKGMYRVYIKADVGELVDFHEVDVYCFIDKWDYNLDHYKEIDPDKKAIMTSDLKFFKN